MSKSLDEKQCCQILGVSSSISLDDLKKAYHKLASIHHPDRPSGNADKFKEINVAYDRLQEILSKKAGRPNHAQQAKQPKSHQESESAQSAKDQYGDDAKKVWQAFREKMNKANAFQNHQSDQPSASSSSYSNASSSSYSNPSSNPSSYESHGQAQAKSTVSYDETLEVETQPTLSEKIFEITQDLSGMYDKIKEKGLGYFDKWTKSMHDKGKDAQLILKIDIPTLLHGATKRILINRLIACPQCHGNDSKSCTICEAKGRIQKKEEIEVVVPPSLEMNEKIKVTAKGSEGLNGQISGDLYLIAQIEGLEAYIRKGLDLELQVGVSKEILKNGGDVGISLLRGHYKIKIPPNSFTGRKLKIPQQGLSSQDSSRIGDMMITLKEVH
jgi:DnaJ-class molecular chaperone